MQRYLISSYQQTERRRWRWRLAVTVAARRPASCKWPAAASGFFWHQPMKRQLSSVSARGYGDGSSVL